MFLLLFFYQTITFTRTETFWIDSLIDSQYSAFCFKNTWWLKFCWKNGSMNGWVNGWCSFSFYFYSSGYTMLPSKYLQEGVICRDSILYHIRSWILDPHCVDSYLASTLGNYLLAQWFSFLIYDIGILKVQSEF